MGGSEGGGEGGGSISAKLLCLLTGDIPFDESFGFFVVFEAYLISSSSSSRVSSSTRGHQSDPSFIFFSPVGPSVVQSMSAEHPGGLPATGCAPLIMLADDVCPPAYCVTLPTSAAASAFGVISL